MKRTAIAALALAFVSVWVALAAGLAAVWLTEEVRVVGLMVPTAIVASLLVLYFDWRERLLRRMLADPKDA